MNNASLHIRLITALGLLLAGCLQDNGENRRSRDLVIVFHGMEPVAHAGLSLRVSDMETGAAVADSILPAGMAGSFSVSLPGILQPGGNYTIEFHADVNGNGVYDPPPADWSWRLSAAGVSDNVAYDFHINRDFSLLDIPSPPRHDLVMELSGMVKDEMFRLRAVDAQSGRVHADTVIAALPQPDYKIRVPGALVQGRPYHIAFFSDYSGNGGYDAPPADWAWRIENVTAEADTAIPFAFNTQFTDIGFPPDSLLDLAVDFSGMALFMNSAMALFVRDAATGEAAGMLHKARISKSEFSETLEDVLVSGRQYHAEVYVDRNGNGGYEPTSDTAWRLDLGVSAADLELDFPAGWFQADIQAPGDSLFTLTASFSGFDGWTGRMFRAFLVDTLVDSIVGTEEVKALSAGAFSLDFENVLENGAGYVLEYYLDADYSGRYDDPDEGWVREIPFRGADVEMTFARDSAFSLLETVSESLFGFAPAFTGLEAWAGHLLFVQVKDRQYDRVVADTVIPYISGGGGMVDFGDILVQYRSYTVLVSVDVNRNSVYDAPPADYAWRYDIVGVSGDLSPEYAFTADFADIGLSQPAPKKLVFTASGLDAYVGKQLYVSVQDAVYGAALVQTTGDTIAGPGLSLELAGPFHRGRIYDLDVYIDMDTNGAYSAPPADHAWRKVFEMKSDSTVVLFMPDTLFFDINH